MSVKIKFKTIKTEDFQFNAAVFLPDSADMINHCALFTHGYTASKSDNISWAQRLSEAGIPSVIFDQPGHLLGSINTVASFDVYKEKAHHCFIDAWNFLNEELPTTFKTESFILGGHSLGALMSVKALELEPFKSEKSMAIGVGLGIGQHKNTHIFESSFYQKTLNIRRQLVCAELDSDNVFPWIKEEKENILTSDSRVHLITGADDVVVGAGGMEAFAQKLIENGNQVTTYEPKKLAHHEPSMASTQIYHFLKKELAL